MEGKISMHCISILIDPRSSHSYMMPKVVKDYDLNKKRHDKSWLVQLATRTKWKVSEVIKECPMELNGFSTVAELNILSMGSCDALIRMDWLEKHRSKLDYYHKMAKCCDDEGSIMEIKGV